MKRITITIEETDAEMIHNVSKTIDWTVYEAFPWSTMADVFHRTVEDLDNQLDLIKSQKD